MLTAIVDGIKPGKPEETRLAAVVALQNSLEFCEENFTREHERNMLMQVSVRAGAGAPHRTAPCSWRAAFTWPHGASPSGVYMRACGVAQVVCEATQSSEARVRAAAFECVSVIVEHYYAHLEQVC